MPVPDYVEITLPPFNESHDPLTAVNLTQPLLNRAIRLRNRIKTLVYAFYLGILFAYATSDQKTHMRRVVSSHYYTTSMKIHDIFSARGIRQIYGTLEVTFYEFRQLTRAEVQQLTWL
ncbi:8964_t:CDS:1, partial [Gigaspora rosea]